MNNIIKTIKSKEFGRAISLYITIIVFFTIIFSKTTIHGIITSILFLIYVSMTLHIDSKISK